MKKILGLDLGTSSIGWAVVELETPTPSILGMGSRIIPLTIDDETQFSKGQAITKNSERTARRTARKRYDRYQMRRSKLKEEMIASGIVPKEILHPIDLWEIRSRAASDQVSLPELGRVLLHINRKRGYKSGKDDYNDSVKSKHVQGINDNYRYLKENDLTIGQYFYSRLKSDGSFRVKDIVYPRLAYMEEFDRIIECQKKYYPEILTSNLIKRLKEETIFYQRRLKSCKHLVSICEFEKKEYTKADGSVIINGPHVAPKSSPVAQLCKVWEFINTIRITNRYGENLPIENEKRKLIAEYLKRNDKLKIKDLQRIVGYNKKEWFVEKTTFQRTVGNTTFIRLENALLGKYDDLLRLNVNFTEYSDKNTGEIRKMIDESIKTEPLFRLWHTLYSIDDEKELRSVLNKKFNISDENVLDNLCKIDFVKEGYASKSNTAIRKILPFLIEGYVYSDACSFAGYNHSNYSTKEENLSRVLSSQIDNLKKGELRQPVVEKILNQTINVVNALNSEFGPFDEIHVELARNLKQSRDEREKTTRLITKNEKENKVLAERVSEYGFTPTKSRILKMKLWKETCNLCVYCGKPVNVREFLSGIDVEKEHIIPRSLLFDNSHSNVTCSCRRCNQEKNKMTAYDYMKTKGEAEFENYVLRVTSLKDKGYISYSKYKKLLMPQESIPSDFIERQMRETQYVSKKAIEFLQQICYNVHATSGSVTKFLRHTWGWDNVLHDLHFRQYKEVGLTEIKEIANNGGSKTKEAIIGWSKRMDHRHHAIDALAIACTSQGMIQQLNSLNTLKDIPLISYNQYRDNSKEKYSKLEKYILSKQQFTTADVKSAVDNIIVSFKSGKKVVTPGKRYVYSGGKRILKQQTLVPRGALSDQTVYGKILSNGKEQVVVRIPISKIDLKKAEKIVDEKIKDIIINHLRQHNDVITEDCPVLDHQGRRIRSVRVFARPKTIVPLKTDANGKANGFVVPENNHHIALYKDENSIIHENIVTFWHAVERKKYGMSIIIKDPSQAFDSLPENLPDSFLAQLPSPDWTFITSIQSNEMFVLGMKEEDYQDAVRDNDIPTLSKNMFRVQSISHNDYLFRHHLETTTDDKYNGVENKELSRQLNKFKRIKSITSFFAQNPHKVRVDNLGRLHYD